MPRVVEVTLPQQQTGELTSRLATLDQVVSVRVERGISVSPPGDVVTIAIADRSLPDLLKLLDELGINENPQATITTSRPASITSSASSAILTRDSSESTWEEVEHTLNRESVMTLNSMMTMALAGFIAALGILTNALHLVIGAMIIAPGFEPISRIALGIVSTSPAWRRGLADTVKGYVALVIGAMTGTFIVLQLGYSPDNTQSSYHAGGVLLSYWSSMSAASLWVSLAASIAGGVLVITIRSVLTAGVMVALALVPAATLIGIGIASGEGQLAAQGLSRLLIEMGLVFVGSLLVFGWKRFRIERRKMSM